MFCDASQLAFGFNCYFLNAPKQLEDERDRLSRELAFEKQLKQDAIKIQQEQALKLQQLQHNGIFTSSLHQPLPAQIKISQMNRVKFFDILSCTFLFTLLQYL